MKKKVFAMAGALALVAAVGVGSTLAYFTDKDSAVNVVTTGHVDIDVVESTETGKTNDLNGLDFKNVMPGQTIDKHAKVLVKSGSQDCYVRVKVNAEWVKTVGNEKVADEELNKVCPLVVCSDRLDGQQNPNELTEGFVDLYWSDEANEGWIYSKNDDAWYFCERVKNSHEETREEVVGREWVATPNPWNWYAGYWKDVTETRTITVADPDTFQLKALKATDKKTLFEEVEIPTSWNNAVADGEFHISIDAEAIQAAYVDGTVSFDSNGGNFNWPNAEIIAYDGSEDTILDAVENAQ